MLEINGRKGLKIFFNEDNPELYLEDKSLYGMTQDEVKLALKKPFILTKDLEVCFEWKGKAGYFNITKGYDWNGANIPAGAWLIIGQPKEPRIRLASMVHDYMCEHHNVVNNDRYLSTAIFEALCKHFGRFNNFKCWAMFHSVDNFQKLFGKDLEGKKWK